MRATERMDLLEKIGLELQSRYSYVEVDMFLNSTGARLNEDNFEGSNSKRLYVKHKLLKATDDELRTIAAELGLAGAIGQTVLEPPANWKGEKGFRLFLSHISANKDVATKLKNALVPHQIASFVAHEDIHPTLSWQDEIERALNTMDAFVAIHTKGFKDSYWTQQEVGFALGRGTKVISFSMDEDPVGFIGKHQAIRRQNRTAPEIAAEIMRLLRNDPHTNARLEEASRAMLAEVGFYADDPPSQPALENYVGRKVFHQKFGDGVVTAADGKKLDVNFDKAGPKRVLADFLQFSAMTVGKAMF